MIRVLVATDGSDLAVAAAGRAVSLLPPDARYTVLSVVRPSTFVAGTGAGLAPVALDPAVTAEAEQLAEGGGQAAVDATAAAIGAQADRRVVDGEPGTVICQVARDEAFDLIVVGSHGAGVLKRVLVGSVSHHVLHHATCPVLVVRDAGADNH